MLYELTRNRKSTVRVFPLEQVLSKVKVESLLATKMATKSQLRKAGSKTGSSKELLTSKSDVRARSGGKKRVTMEVLTILCQNDTV